ncbi:MAG: hypothetical protein JWQ88_1621 [Rhodoferax sp.]|nr:hypothetical protein [Rhodoferax sp.]
MRCTELRLARCAAAFALLCQLSPAHAEAPASGTWDVQTTHNRMTSGLPAGEALSVRANWALAGGDNVQAELMEERKFGDRGGIAALGYTHVFSDDWFGNATAVYGHGGPNWADLRLDLQLSRKWLPGRQLVTSFGVYRALYDAGRNDSGFRLSAAYYQELPLVWEAGVTLNTSEPGGVHSQMPFVSLTVGRDREQYLSLRLNRGTEAYQALGTESQLVNFHSRSATATWRRWFGPAWGVSALVEHYHNPYYERRTLGVGMFAQW